MNDPESEINEQLAQGRMLEHYLTAYGGNYRMGPMGSVKHTDGKITPVFVLLHCGHSKGTFYSVQELLSAVQDLKLRAEMQREVVTRQSEKLRRFDSPR